MRRMYSQNRLNQIIKEAIANGLLDDVNIKVKTLSQSQANASVDFSATAPSTLSTGLEYSPKYCRLEEINGVLYLVWNFGLKNTTESNVNIGWLRMNLNVPESIAKRIYDFANKSVHEESYSPITAFEVFTGSTDYPQDILANSYRASLNNASANVMTLNMYANIAIKSDNEMFLTGRVVLTLI